LSLSCSLEAGGVVAATACPELIHFHLGSESVGEPNSGGGGTWSRGL
jgi:hypothetical protein